MNKISGRRGELPVSTGTESATGDLREQLDFDMASGEQVGKREKRQVDEFLSINY